jgi:hypothetical protein
MSLTTKQKLEDNPHMAYLIDQSNEVLRWGAHEDSTEEYPVVTIEVYLDAPEELIGVTYGASA